MKIVYKEVREAFEALEDICELYEQVSIDDERQELMRTPTKKKAADMYLSGVWLWFQQEDGYGNDHPDVEWVREKYL